KGATILFIDHKLEEVLEIADSITVLRQGRTIATVDPKDVTAGDLAELMVGSELPVPDTTDSTVTDQVSLQVEGLTVLDADRRRVVDDVSLTIHRGEIVGIAGVEGNGQHELVSAIIGTMTPDSGTVSLNGNDLALRSVRERREAGMAYVPQDRHVEGLLLDAPLWENTALGHQTEKPFSKGIWIDRAGTRARTEEICDWYDVRTPNVDVSAHALSGGNQQKLILGREITSEPDLLIASHPTRGIDVGAQAAVWDHLRTARAGGLATLLISADLDELIGLSDTIVVMFHGKLVATLDPADVTPRVLGAYMTGARLDDDASARTAPPAHPESTPVTEGAGS
ncbi:MAG: ATP-binding cassette domain-containing protein, partial [Ilumatobacter sp.]